MDLLLELFEDYRTVILGGESAPLMAYRSGGRWNVRTRGQGDVLSKERAGEREREMAIAREGGSGEAETGGVRAALGEDRRSNEAGVDGSPIVGDSEGGEVDVAGIYGLREVEYGGSPVGLQSVGA